jgi:hypothetical protein
MVMNGTAQIEETSPFNDMCSTQADKFSEIAVALRLPVSFVRQRPKTLRTW